MDMVFCNRCTTFRGESRRKFLLFDCGDVYCESCAHDGRCPQCDQRNHVDLTEENLQKYFCWEQHARGLTTVLKLQESQYAKLKNVLIDAREEIENYQGKVQTCEEKIAELENQALALQQRLLKVEEERRRVFVAENIRKVAARHQPHHAHTFGSSPSSKRIQVVPSFRRDPPSGNSSTISFTSSVAHDLQNLNVNWNKAGPSESQSIQRPHRPAYGTFGEQVGGSISNMNQRSQTSYSAAMKREEMRTNPAKAIREMLSPINSPKSPWTPTRRAHCIFRPMTLKK